MKDLRAVLRQKEQDVERIRREIQELLTVIPLLADAPPAPDDVRHYYTWPLLERSWNLPTMVWLIWKPITPSSGTCDFLSVREGVLL